VEKIGGVSGVHTGKRHHKGDACYKSEINLRNKGSEVKFSRWGGKGDLQSGTVGSRPTRPSRNDYRGLAEAEVNAGILHLKLIQNIRGFCNGSVKERVNKDVSESTKVSKGGWRGHENQNFPGRLWGTEIIRYGKHGGEKNSTEPIGRNQEGATRKKNKGCGGKEEDKKKRVEEVALPLEKKTESVKRVKGVLRVMWGEAGVPVRTIR